jgi:hypothetical protein
VVYATRLRFTSGAVIKYAGQASAMQLAARLSVGLLDKPTRSATLQEEQSWKYQRSCADTGEE